MGYNYLSFANMPFSCCLPTGRTNFGGDIQVFTLPDYITSGPWGMNLNCRALSLLNCPQQTIYNNWGLTPGLTFNPGLTPFGFSYFA